MITATVKAFDHFEAIDDAVERLAVTAVEQAAAAGAAAAAGVASQRSVTGTMARMTVHQAGLYEDGVQCGFASGAHYSGFQNYGTLGQRKRRVSADTVRRRSSGSGQARREKSAGSAGIAPLRFFEAGRLAGRRRLIDVIKRGL